MSNSKYYVNIFLKWPRAILKLVIHFWGSDVNSQIQLSRGNLQAAIGHDAHLKPGVAACPLSLVTQASLINML